MAWTRPKTIYWGTISKLDETQLHRQQEGVQGYARGELTIQGGVTLGAQLGEQAAKRGTQATPSALRKEQNSSWCSGGGRGEQLRPPPDVAASSRPRSSSSKAPTLVAASPRLICIA